MKENPLQIRHSIAVEMRGGWWGNRKWYCRVSYDQDIRVKADDTYSLGFRICRTTKGDQ